MFYINLKLNVILLFSVVGLLSLNVNAEDSIVEKQTFLESNIGFSFAKGNKEKDTFFRLASGFYLEENISFGTGLVYLEGLPNTDYIIGLETFVRGYQKVGELGGFYADLGLTTIGEHFVGGVGLKYPIGNSNFSIDVGYRYYGGVSKTKGDIYTFSSGVTFRF